MMEPADNWKSVDLNSISILLTFPSDLPMKEMPGWICWWTFFWSARLHTQVYCTDLGGQRYSCAWLVLPWWSFSSLSFADKQWKWGVWSQCNGNACWVSRLTTSWRTWYVASRWRGSVPLLSSDIINCNASWWCVWSCNWDKDSISHDCTHILPR